jgi:PhnB protein
MSKPIPDRYHSVTPSFTFKDSRKAIDFYKRAFSAELIDFLPRLDGEGTMHATMQIGNSMIMMGDEMPGAENCAKSAETTGSCPITLFVYVADVDKTFAQAVSAGGAATMPVTDMFWGDRMGQIKDPFNYLWSIATHKQDLTEDEVKKGAQAFFSQMGTK